MRYVMVIVKGEDLDVRSMRITPPYKAPPYQFYMEAEPET